MRKTALILATVVAISTSLSSCGSHEEEKTKGENQVQDPVLNSGPETERDRAQKAVRDSTDDVVKDSVGQGNDLPDSVTSPSPHR